MEIRYWGIGWMSRKDGPGNRVVVYLQGCPGDCPWCQSPHSRYQEAPLMFQEQFCVLCGRCETACPNGVHKITEQGHLIDWKKCVRCGKCVETCLHSGKGIPNSPLMLLTCQRRVEELFEELLPQLEVVKRKGGITLSGGEALMQAEAAEELLKLCKRQGIHTCVETSMLLPEHIYAHAGVYIDHWLSGFREVYLPGTVASESIRESCSRKVRAMREGGAGGFTARFPVIAGYTDDGDTLKLLCECLNESGIRELEIFPCNPHTGHYYKLMGKEVREDISKWIPNAERMQKIQEFFEENGLQVKQVN